VEMRLHLRLQDQVHDRLGDPVSHRRHTERSHAPAVLLRHLNRPDRRRHVAPRGHPIPEPVEVPLQVPLKPLDRLPVDTCRPLLALTLSHASQTSRLEITNGLPSGFGPLTGSSRVIAVDRQASQDDPPPSLHPHYRASQLPRGGPSLCSASVRCSSRVPPLGGLPSANDRGPLLRHWPLAGAKRQVPTFHTRARAELAPPSCRTPPGQ
jgi:hypothetical protein